MPVPTRATAYRTADAESTMDLVRPMLPFFGITRVADITGLDEIGVPTHVAYRPTGRTLAVSLGTALTPTQSWVGAVMESVESWHGENPLLDVATRARARSLDLPYDVGSLKLAERSLLTASTELDWVVARGLLTGADCLVPFDAIRLDFTARHSWAHALFDPSSNGLATGNTLVEATVHALLELVERDCATPYTVTPLDRRRYADPTTTDHPVAAAVLDALRRAGCWVELCDTTNGLGIPGYACSIHSRDVPMIYGGFGCHLDGGMAAARALMEAVQSRLAAVSGARDDIDGVLYVEADPGWTPESIERVRHPVRGAVGPSGDLDAVLRFCATRVFEKTGVEPFAVDLTRPDVGIPAVKVFAPGLAVFTSRDVSSRPGEHDV